MGLALSCGRYRDEKGNDSNSGWSSAVPFDDLEKGLKLSQNLKLAVNNSKIRIKDIPTPGATCPNVDRRSFHSGEVTALDFSEDGRSFASGSADCTIKIWEVNFISIPSSLYLISYELEASLVKA